MGLRRVKDVAARGAGLTTAVFVLSLAFLMAYGLLVRALPVLEGPGGVSMLASGEWHPARGQFGVARFVVGTLWVTGIAMLLAVPASVLTALYLAEYASRRLRGLATPVIDVLAGISPVVYGVWGTLVVVPLIRDHLVPLAARLRALPFASQNSTGFSALAGGVVLAVMVTPIMVAIVEEVLRAIPFEVREASLALGASRWQTTRSVVLRRAWPGVVAAVILGFSRAAGETMAVLMVAGCALHVVPRAPLDPAYPLPALIANTYGEMMSVPRYDAAILFAALVLFLLTVAFNSLGWGILLRLEKRLG